MFVILEKLSHLLLICVTAVKRLVVIERHWIAKRGVGELILTAEMQKKGQCVFLYPFRNYFHSLIFYSIPMFVCVRLCNRMWVFTKVGFYLFCKSPTNHLFDYIKVFDNLFWFLLTSIMTVWKFLIIFCDSCWCPLWLHGSYNIYLFCDSYWCPLWLYRSYNVYFSTLIF